MPICGARFAGPSGDRAVQASVSNERRKRRSCRWVRIKEGRFDMEQNRAEKADIEKGQLSDTSLRAIRDALRDLEFGSVTLIVQDGLVIQVDRLEKRRLRRPR